MFRQLSTVAHIAILHAIVIAFMKKGFIESFCLFVLVFSCLFVFVFSFTLLFANVCVRK